MALSALEQQKRGLRIAMRRIRRALGDRDGRAVAAAARLPACLLGRFAVVASYRPIGAEMDPDPLARRFEAAGATIVLPVAAAIDAPLVFRARRRADRLTPDAAGVPAPPPSSPERRPALVIVPVLAFDRAGARLGQGAGLYDRTLAELRLHGPLFALGLAFSAQEAGCVPVAPGDAMLDAILTEKAYIVPEEEGLRSG